MPSRRFPIGAEITPPGVSFRVWAPDCERIEAVFDGAALKPIILTPEPNGYFSAVVADAKAGTRYRFCLDGGTLAPDPASRSQPDGPHGSSQVIDPTFAWTDASWAGVTAAGQVLYEMHIGTFTQTGTWLAAIEQLPSLKKLGVTCLEVMPVNEFAGECGWGYDGVNLFAPYHHYGTPDDMRRFVDAAHALGLGVVLDVVYNHFGPDGNTLPHISKAYFSEDKRNDWGDAINFDGPNSGPVREFFLTNALYWTQEFHLDGFRFDATQAITDSSPTHILREITEKCRAAAGRKSLYIVNENEPQETDFLRPISAGGFGMDANWNDDFHHAATAALTGHTEAYFTDHPGTPQEFISAAKYGYIYQGQHYKWHQKRRGTPTLDIPPTGFVNFIQNHDQIANSARGQRVDRLTSPAELRAMTAFLLLAPQTPMLFQGQEWSASSPFLYFSGHQSAVAPMIKTGRAKELSQFASIATPDMQAALRDPSERATFADSKLDHAERDRPGHRETFELHRALIALRRTDPIFRRVPRRGDIDGAVLAEHAWLVRYFGDDGDDRLLIVNLGIDVHLNPAPEPLLAPPVGKRWASLLSTEDPQYGGNGSPHPDTEDEGWYLHGRCATMLRPLPESEASVPTRKADNSTGQAPLAKSESKESVV